MKDAWSDTPTKATPAPSDLRAMQRRIGRFQGSSYDISATCNLTCEGNLFFARADVSDIPQGRDVDWARLFAAEAARGVNFAYIAGAEPSMVPARLRAAWLDGLRIWFELFMPLEDQTGTV